MSKPKYGPTRGEHKFWLGLSIIGLASVAFALFYRGFSGPALVEVGLFGSAVFLFLGGRAVKALFFDGRDD